MTHPMAMSASYCPDSASFFETNGNSKEPGTRTTSTALLAAPARSNASRAAVRSRSVIKLLKRLTTIPNLYPLALSPPSILSGFIFSAIFGPSRSFLPTGEFCRSLLQKRLRSLAHVLRRTRQTKERGFEEEAFFLRHFHTAFDRLHRVLHGHRRVCNDFLRHRLRRGKKFRRFVDVIDEPDPLRFFRGNHFAGQAKFLSHAFSTQPR